MPGAYHYTLRRSKRAKRIILRVNHVGAVEVVVPWYVAYKHGERFLQQQLEWIKKVQARILKQRPAVPVCRVDEGQAQAQAQIYFETVTGEMAQQLGLLRPIVKIADFRSQWGSCNRRTATIKFSWRLIVAPETVARYVAAHETAHLIEASHGEKFWKVVERLDPNFQEARRWLRRQGLTWREPLG